MIDLSGKHILITGASGGLGRAVSQKASSLGAKLSLIGRNQARLEETFHVLDGADHAIVVADIANLESIQAIVQDIVAKSGVIGGFVHCAGMEKTQPFKSSKPRVFQEIFNINVFSGFEFWKAQS